jgi:hypothetical protein
LTGLKISDEEKQKINITSVKLIWI